LPLEPVKYETDFSLQNEFYLKSWDEDAIIIFQFKLYIICNFPTKNCTSHLFVKINGVNQSRDGIKLKARKQKTERFPTSYFINYAREIQPSKQ
jgi:hypothetical protein